MAYEAYFGFDPGKTGGMARILADGTVTAWPLDRYTERDLWDLFAEEVLPYSDSGTALIEYVHSGGTMGVKSLWTLASSYFCLRAYLIASELRFEEVRPTEWQGGMDCKTGGDKKISRAKAQQLWPHIKQTNDKLADAMLIAEYCRRTRG